MYLIDPNIFQRPTSYDNPFSRGDRRGIITITKSSDLVIAQGSLSDFIDGAIVNMFYFSGQSNVGKYIIIDFGRNVVIDEVRTFQSNIANHGLWKWQGCLDGDTTFVDVSEIATWGVDSGATPSFYGIDTSLAGSTTGYRYYKKIGVGGSVSGVPYIQELEFKVSG